ncbi:MAG: recombinase family protein [Candidatus Acidiferrales bacterium]
MKQRCAVYARYSSGLQSPTSIDDQIRKCREYADQQGWTVLENQLYADRAISGTSSEREGLKRLMAAAAAKDFDIVLADDSSRLSRHMVDALRITEKLRFAGIRVICVSQNIDSESEQGETLAVVHGLVDSLYVRELATKTRRGLEGKALNRLHTGGRIFGYKSVPIEDPNRRDQYGRPLVAGVRLEIDEEQAKVVRRIFQLYASGLSIKGVTKKLNGERKLSPQPRAGRQRSWAPSSVRVILRNQRYQGIVTWARTRKVRNPESGKRVRRLKPESEWLRVEMPEQRIISEKLWRAVEERVRYITAAYGDRGRKGGLMNARLASSPYIFSGLLRCGLCGASYIIVSGGGKNHRIPHYGCPNQAFRGTCKNTRRVRRDTLEGELLSKLQADVLSDRVIDYLLERLEAEIEKRSSALDADMEAMQERKAALEAELHNLTRAVASGMDSPSIRAAIGEREREISALVEKTTGREKGSVHRRVQDLRKFVRESVAQVRELIAGQHGNPSIVRAELGRHVDAITLLPDGETIRYKGNWKVLGAGYTDGAEGQS